jgi:hypothetical protein
MAPKAPTPSLSPPAGVPPSGNGKFIVLAVLLVGGVGAVIGWRACQKPQAPMIIAFDAGPPPGPSKNIDDDIPPPPAIEDSGADDAGKKTTVVTSAGNGGCDVKKCTGASNSDVETALAFRAKQAHRCYDNALGQDPTLRGKMSIAVRIGPSGQSCSASVASNELSSAPSVADCVVRSFRGQTFPAPKGGCIDVNVPINFVPRQ